MHEPPRRRSEPEHIASPPAPIQRVALPAERASPNSTVKSSELVALARSGAGAAHAIQNVRQAQRQVGNRAVHAALAQAESEHTSSNAVPANVEAQIEHSRAGGAPLDSDVQAEMESSLNTDFGQVRIHADTQADAAARALDARAFTTGQDVFFRTGEYDSRSSSGRQLLAHELTHVAQQSDGVARKLVVGEPDDEYEREAEGVARSVMQSPITNRLAVDGSRVQRQEDVGTHAEAVAAPDASTAAAPGQTADAGVTTRDAGIVADSGAPVAKNSPVADFMTPQLQHEWIAVVLAEAAPANVTQETEITWVYYNLMVKERARGLDRSSARRTSDVRYLIWLYKQGAATEKQGQKPIGDDKRKGSPNEFAGKGGRRLNTVAEVATAADGQYQWGTNEARLTRVREVVRSILAGVDDPRYAGFDRQGNLKDFNSLSGDNNVEWRKARYYFEQQSNHPDLRELVHFLVARPAYGTQFTFNIKEIDKYLKAEKITNINAVPVKNVDVRDGKAVFVDTADEILALPRLASKVAPAGAVHRQTTPPRTPTPAPAASSTPVPAATPAATSTAATDAAAAPATTWEEEKKSKQPLVIGKNLEQIEKIIGGTQYSQLSDVTTGVAKLILPVFQELAADNFKGLEFEPDPEARVDEVEFRETARKAKEYMGRILQTKIERRVDALVHLELDNVVDQIAGMSAADAQQRIAQLPGETRIRILSDAALMQSVVREAQQDAATQLAQESAVPLCFFIGHYLYYRAINRINPATSFATWYRTQIRRGHAGVGKSGGIVVGATHGSISERTGLEYRDSLDKIPADIRLALSRQQYKPTSEHWMVIFKDSTGTWRNLDHVTAGGQWHGEPTLPAKLKQVWYVPAMTPTAAAPQPPPAQTPPAALPSPTPAPARSAEPTIETLTPEEKFLLQNIPPGISSPEGLSIPQL